MPQVPQDWGHANAVRIGDRLMGMVRFTCTFRMLRAQLPVHRVLPRQSTLLLSVWARGGQKVCQSLLIYMNWKIKIYIITSLSIFSLLGSSPSSSRTLSRQEWLFWSSAPRSLLCLFFSYNRWYSASAQLSHRFSHPEPSQVDRRDQSWEEVGCRSCAWQGFEFPSDMSSIGLKVFLDGSYFPTYECFAGAFG